MQLLADTYDFHGSQASPQSQRFGLYGLINPPSIRLSPKLNDFRRMSRRERMQWAFALHGVGGRGDADTVH
jgi:hypothetical protein